MDEFLQLLESVTLLRKEEESLMTMKLLQQVFSAKGITKMASLVGSFMNHMDILVILTKFFFPPPPRNPPSLDREWGFCSNMDIL